MGTHGNPSFLGVVSPIFFSQPYKQNHHFWTMGFEDPKVLRLENIYLEPFDDLCFDWSLGLVLEGLGPFKHRGQLGLRYIHLVKL